MLKSAAPSTERIKTMIARRVAGFGVISGLDARGDISDAVSLPEESASRQRRKIAIVHDWLPVYAGAERVLEQMLHVYPEADVFSILDFIPEGERGFLQNKKVKTSVRPDAALGAEEIPLLPPHHASRHRAVRRLRLRPRHLQQLRRRQGRHHRPRPAARLLLPFAHPLCLGSAEPISCRGRLAAACKRNDRPPPSALHPDVGFAHLATASTASSRIPSSSPAASARFTDASPR